MDRKHKLLPIYCLVLALLAVDSSQAQTLLTFTRSTNQITVTCIPEASYYYRVIPANGSMITFTSAMREYTFDVTPQTEQTVSCSQSQNSGFVGDTTFAANPIVDEERRVERLLSYLGTKQSLTCPYDLGSAANVIEPYHHMWLADGIVTEDQTKNLTVDVSEDSPSLYSCAIRMRLCSTTSSSSTCMSSSETLPESDRRIQFNITKIERLSIMTPPDEQNVTEGSPATFSCSARGTSTEVIWKFSGMNYTKEANNCNEGSGVNNCVDTSRNNGIINSTLRIMSTSLSDNSTSIVRCIVRQSFDGNIEGGLDNADFNPNYQLPDDFASAETSLIVTAMPETPTPTTPTTTPTTPSPSTEPSGLAPQVSITIIILVIVLVIAASVIIMLLTFLYCHYHYKYKGDESKLGRYLRSVSRPSGRYISTHRDNMPTDGNGHIHPGAFQSAHSLNGSSFSDTNTKGPNNGNQDVEGIYNISQYSGLSGVSNQDGQPHNMPVYYPSGTDLSAASTSHTNGNGTHLQPPLYSTVPRCSKSDYSDNSKASSNEPIPLTQEALLQHSSAFNPSPQQTRSAAYNNPAHNGLQPTGPQHKSDTGLPSQPFYLKRPSPKPVIPSPALAVIDGSPLIEQPPSAPFPHKEAPAHAPFPNEKSNNPKQPGNISEETMEIVLNCLMHNRNCQIPNCPCYSVRKLYSKQLTSKKQTDTLKSQQSSSSDSDSTMGRRSRLFLPLSSQDEPGLHPHFHPGRKLLVRGARPRPPLARRRSKSVDLSPHDCSDGQPKTPKVGGSLIGTPVCAPQHTFEDAINQELQKQSTPFEGANRFLPTPFSNKGRDGLPSPCTPETHNGYLHVFSRSNSMSADDIPTLCLNDCPLSHSPRENTMRAPPQINRQPSVAGKPALSTIGEKKRSTDESDTSSRADSPPDLTQSDHDKDNVVSEDSGRGASVSDSIHSVRGRLIRQPTVEHETPAREISYGYQTESEASLSTSMCSLKPRSARSITSIPGSDRSASPAYETVVTYSDDGSQVHTTEC